ncbi:MAG: dihydropteroate synthase [Acidobacteriota bacterium]
MPGEEQVPKFIIVGENIHATRVVLRQGKLVTTNPEGVESVRYTDGQGAEHFLPIPEKVKQEQDYLEGRVKHVRIAVQLAMSGREPEASQGLAYLRYLVDRQVQSGADFLDLNVDEVSLRVADQKEAMKWLVKAVREMCPTPVSVDSSHIEIIEAGMEACDGGGRALLNSASLERLDALDLAVRFNAQVVVTAAGEKGMPQSAEERVVNACRMVEASAAKGIPLSDLYIDPLVFPVSVDSEYGGHCLDAIRQLRTRFGPEIHITGGLSNVSFGLPLRRLLNDVFILLAIDAGADSGIVDPVTSNVSRILSMDRESKAYRLAADVLLGRDRNCKSFLKAYRAKELETS